MKSKNSEVYRILELALFLTIAALGTVAPVIFSVQPAVALLTAKTVDEKIRINLGDHYER
jgi:hypothetical protein